MNNDVIRNINTTLESAENLKAAGANEITLDLDSYITILKRLAKYENMEPAGHFIVSGDGFIGEVFHEFNNDPDVFNLYRHPNK
ncbi:hypothetical protein Xsto_00411 [Xenorhabdus stockiae]|uniref:Uncharacterized protein n=1 Tax=Xenorhabdus stockiae TaxID=351614 RepID=A0A2D0KVX9_9GAMM|nr:hypothetical protein [Xenorhabdus stockiae]PHM67528.1 hypothetical protein Xsto_00411 [Xenorhabdus stockiae]